MSSESHTDHKEVNVMAALPTLDELMAMDVAEWSGELVPFGLYNGVITNVEVRDGQKGPYLNLEVTLHDDEYAGRKVWRNSSFSEKALAAPAGIAELVQATKPDIAAGTSPEDIPGAIAQAILGSAVGIEVDHEQRWKSGAPMVDASTGEPVMRETIKAFFQPTDEFVESVEKQSAGMDDDLPF
jgi:hypothetical protein